MSAPSTVLFDGVCNLCNATVRFVIANDPGRRFRFASLQSAAGAHALTAFGRDPAAAASIVVIDGDGVHERSDAALRVARGLRAPWCWLAVLALIPRALRDPVYDVIARNRYRLFGRRDVCRLPSAAEQTRFLEEEPA